MKENWMQGLCSDLEYLKVSFIGVKYVGLVKLVGTKYRTR